MDGRGLEMVATSATAERVFSFAGLTLCGVLFLTFGTHVFSDFW